MLGAVTGELDGPAGFTPGLSITDEGTEGAVGDAVSVFQVGLGVGASVGITGVGVGCEFNFWASISTCRLMRAAGTVSD